MMSEGCKTTKIVETKRRPRLSSVETASWLLLEVQVARRDLLVDGLSRPSNR